MFTKYRYPIVILAILAAGAIGLISWLSRAPEDPQILIPKSIATVESAVERGNISGVMQIVSRDYSDAAGNTYRHIARIVRGGMYLDENWVISSQILSLQASDKTANARIRVHIYPNSEPKAGSEYEISSIWHLEGRTWRVISASGWQDIQQSTF